MRKSIAPHSPSESLSGDSEGLVTTKPYILPDFSLYPVYIFLPGNSSQLIVFQLFK